MVAGTDKDELERDMTTTTKLSSGNTIRKTREYNQKNAEHMMTAPEGVGYCLAVKK